MDSSNPLKMPDDFILHTPQGSRGKKYFVIILLILVILFVLLFVIKLIGAVWTLRYGTESQKQALSDKVNPSFTLSPEQALKKRGASSKIEAQKLIRKHNPTLGRPDAPIKIIAFIDFECPYCQQSYPIFKQMQEQYGDVIQVIFKHFPLGSLHPNALAAAHAATCAQEQGKFWPYYDLLFTKKVLDTESLLSNGAIIGLNTEKFQTCIQNERYINDIQEDMQDGADLGVRGTPTYVVGDKKFEGVVDTQLWERVIVSALPKK